SPQTGRFLQPDPTRYTDNMNLYSYVHGDPVNRTDTGGLGLNCIPQYTYYSVGIDDGSGAMFGQPGIRMTWNCTWTPDALAPTSRPPPPDATSLQNLQNLLCNAGNVLEAKSAELSPLSLKLELAGGVATVAGLLAQPEINPAADVTVGIGLATMLTGAAGGLIATTFQIAGGIAQMLGSDNASVGQANAIAGSATMGVGALVGGIGSSAARAGSSAAARAYNAMVNRNSALAGGAVDAAVSRIPGLDPLQADCRH